MTRPALIFATVLFCAAAWTALGLAAFVGALHLWRLFVMLSSPWLIALVLIAGGALQLLIGLALHYSGARRIGTGQRLQAVAASGRHLAAVGAIFLSMGAGAVLAIEAGAL